MAHAKAAGAQIVEAHACRDQARWLRVLAERGTVSAWLPPGRGGHGEPAIGALDEAEYQVNIRATRWREDDEQAKREADAA